MIMTVRNNQPIESCSLSDEKLDKVSGGISGEKRESPSEIEICTSMLKCECGSITFVSPMKFYKKGNEYIGQWRCRSCNKLNNASGKLSMLDNGDMSFQIGKEYTL